MSTTILAVIISLLAEILPKLGIVVGSDALTQTASTILVIGSGLVVWYRRYQAGKTNSAAAINALGIRKV